MAEQLLQSQAMGKPQKSQTSRANSASFESPQDTSPLRDFAFLQPWDCPRAGRGESTAKEHRLWEQDFAGSQGVGTGDVRNGPRGLGIPNGTQASAEHYRSGK